VIVRDTDGKYHTHTAHHMVGGGASWGMFWGLLFRPAVLNPGPGHGRRRGMGGSWQVNKSVCDKASGPVRGGRLQPGTSALFLMVEKVNSGQGRRGMSK